MCLMPKGNPVPSCQSCQNTVLRVLRDLLLNQSLKSFTGAHRGRGERKIEEVFVTGLTGFYRVLSQDSMCLMPKGNPVPSCSSCLNTVLCVLRDLLLNQS